MVTFPPKSFASYKSYICFLPINTTMIEIFLISWPQSLPNWSFKSIGLFKNSTDQHSPMALHHLHCKPNFFLTLKALCNDTSQVFLPLMLNPSRVLHYHSLPWPLGAFHSKVFSYQIILKCSLILSQIIFTLSQKTFHIFPMNRIFPFYGSY